MRCLPEEVYVDRAITAPSTGSSDYRVSGVKVHWNHIPLLYRRLRKSLSRSGLCLSDDTPLTELIEKKLGPIQYVWLRRKNKVAQGISHYKATQTEIWSSEAKSDDRVALDQRLTFDFPKIHQHVQQITEHDQCWAQFFKTHQIAPLMLVYEDFIQNPELTLKNLFQFLELPSENLDFSLPNREKQSDGRSKEWEQTYRRIQIDRLQSALADMEGKVAANPSKDSSTGSQKNPKPSAKESTYTFPAEPESPTITAHLINPESRMAIAPASAKREWMDQTANRFAYRCLPLALANQAGWVLLNQRRIEITWNGSNNQDAIRVVAEDGSAPHYVQSHFGHGIVTFLIPYLFRTTEGYNLLMRGPANWPKDAIYPLEGLIETDWLEASSTMNWRLTRPNVPVVFEKDEPIAMIVPMRRGELESFSPKIQTLSDNPSLQEGFARWAQSRGQFNRDLHQPDSEASKQGRQRHYMQGKNVDERLAKEHQTMLKLLEFSGSGYCK